MDSGPPRTTSGISTTAWPTSLYPIRCTDSCEEPARSSHDWRILCCPLSQYLQRDIAVELGVGGLPDLAHAPLADEGGHVVMAEAGADVHRHWPLLPATLQGDHDVRIRPLGARGDDFRILGKRWRSRRQPLSVQQLELITVPPPPPVANGPCMAKRWILQHVRLPHVF